MTSLPLRCPHCGTRIEIEWGDHDMPSTWREWAEPPAVEVEHTRERCRAASGVAKLHQAAGDLLAYVEYDARIRREESGLTLSGLAILTGDLRAALDGVRS